MKILIFCSASLDIRGGSAIRGRLIAEGLKHQGADVGVVAPNVPSYFEELGIVHYKLEELPSNRESGLRQATYQFKPDIIYGITEANTDIIRRVADATQCLVAYDLHGIGVIEILELGWKRGRQIIRLIQSFKWLSYVPKADIVTVANPTLVPVVRWLNKKAVPIVGMADISKFSPDGPRAQLGQDSTRVQVVYAGNFFKWQGTDLLLAAIKKLLTNNEAFEFTIIGSIGRTDEIFSRWEKILNNQHVHLIDSVDFNKIADYYRAADVLVIPRPFMLSTYLALPQKITEYMASGKVTVATNLAPHRWALSNPPSGILCPPTSEGIVEGIRQAKDEGLRKELGQQAHIKATKQFCHIKQCQQIYRLFQELLSS